MHKQQIGTCIAYFTDSDTIKKYWYWPGTDKLLAMYNVKGFQFL